MTDIPAQIAKLPPEKLELLMQRLSQKRTPTGPAGIQPQARTGAPLPLSFAQQRLWFLDQLQPGNPAYHIAAAVRLRGALNVSALDQSLNELVRRHEVLRTTFPLHDGQPVQHIGPSLTIVLPIVEIPAEEPEIQRQAEAEARTPFNLGAGPLLRARLLRLDDTDHVLLLTMHHIISDGWSMDILVRELGALYAAFAAQQPNPLPALPVQYADFALWQRSWLEAGGGLDRHLAYWTTQLGPPFPTLDLPADAPRAPLQEARGARATLELPPHLTHSLKQLAQAEGVTLFTLLLAALDTLLYRLTGQEDIIVGTPVLGRSRVETEGLIGCFLNTLALRANLAGTATTFRELLRQVRAMTLDAFAHQDLPFERLVEALKVPRDLTRSPLFDVMLNMVPPMQAPVALPGLTLERLELDEPESKYDLTLYAEEQAETLRLEVIYRRDLFTPERVATMLAQFQALLQQVVAAPDRPLLAYSLVPGGSPILPDPTLPLPEPRYPFVPEMVATWAERQPAAPAIRQGEQVWSYADLVVRAQGIAQALAASGLGPGTTVAVTGQRSFGLIASMLGVLWSGARLLTLDPHLPAGRHRLMLEIAGASHLLNVGEHALASDAFAAIPPAQRLPVRPETGQVVGHTERGDGTIQLPDLAWDAPAYVFFTSGTTGQPKAILGCHKGLGHFLTWQRDTFGVAPHDRCAQLTALSFDVVLRDVFLALVSGATLCLPADDLHPATLLPWMDAQGITIFHTVPTLAHFWLAHTPPGVALQTVRRIFCAGEPLQDTLIEQWRARFPQTGEIVNLYGPTETTLAKCYYRVPDTPKPGIQPVGQPLPQTQVLVLNQAQQLSGVGERGEIVIRTPFRSFGYLNAPDEAQRRFVPNPFRDDPHDLIYYTGDQGRYRPDGSLEILGRLDHQVKIRGMRVELSEIEVALGHHPALQQVVVVAREDPATGKQLVAYAVPQTDPGPSQREVRRFLQETLPDYMIPSYFILLESLPRTPNGKVDRQALPVPTGERAALDGHAVAPRNEVERTIAAIWQETLQLAQVGVHDNFFELGGHSLLATQIMARLQQACQVTLPLRRLFETPTVAGLAQAVAAAQHAGPQRQRPPLAPVARDQPLPLSFAQQRLWFLYQLEPESPFYNIPAALRIQGQLDVAALETCLNDLAARHEILRTTFPMKDEQAVQMIAPAQRISLTVVDLRGRSVDHNQEAVQRRIIEEAQRPFNLSQAPLWRAKLLQLGDEAYVLVLTFHHIISDGWSLGVIIRELLALYQARRVGQPAPLPELPIQYADFAAWQRGWLHGAVLDQQLAYWRRHLHHAPPLIGLRTDAPRPPTQTFGGATVTMTLPPVLQEELKALCRVEGATLFMGLFAIFQVWLWWHSDRQEDLVVGTDVAGRDQEATEGLIGFFINQLALRVTLAGDPTFHEILTQVRQITLDAYSHQDLPFDKLVEVLNPKRENYTPIFQVKMVLQNMPMPPLALPGLTFETLEFERGTSQLDLQLNFNETPGGLVAMLIYNTSLFQPQTAAQMLARFELLLRQIIARPTLHLSDLAQSLSQAERDQALAEQEKFKQARRQRFHRAKPSPYP
jgi:amino acid adenylation domain-containing protein